VVATANIVNKILKIIIPKDRGKELEILNSFWLFQIFGP
jgi:hypothetical protein